MKREDFKEIKQIHFDTCEFIMMNNGSCDEIRSCVNECPFARANSTTNTMCCDSGYCDENIMVDEDDIQLEESCRIFLETFKEVKKC